MSTKLGQQRMRPGSNLSRRPIKTSCCSAPLIHAQYVLNASPSVSSLSLIEAVWSTSRPLLLSQYYRRRSLLSVDFRRMTPSQFPVFCVNFMPSLDSCFRSCPVKTQVQYPRILVNMIAGIARRAAGVAALAQRMNVPTMQLRCMSSATEVRCPRLLQRLGWQVRFCSRSHSITACPLNTDDNSRGIEFRHR